MLHCEPSSLVFNGSANPVSVYSEPSQWDGVKEIVRDGQKMCIGAASSIVPSSASIHSYLFQFQPIIFDTEETDVILGAAFREYLISFSTPEILTFI